jgi:hypothetical protein
MQCYCEEGVIKMQCNLCKALSRNCGGRAKESHKYLSENSLSRIQYSKPIPTLLELGKITSSVDMGYSFVKQVFYVFLA